MHAIDWKTRSLPGTDQLLGASLSEVACPEDLPYEDRHLQDLPHLGQIRLTAPRLDIRCQAAPHEDCVFASQLPESGLAPIRSSSSNHSMLPRPLLVDRADVSPCASVAPRVPCHSRDPCLFSHYTLRRNVAFSGNLLWVPKTSGVDYRRLTLSAFGREHRASDLSLVI